ncbi:DUF7344 domain-containing protein [Natronomonas marina]|jgi:hypothetical protein|uniref:DUF7344 domain-containing protein n=1 Tax=Natronomonas marina TaxID=2961939 RepID=UPI0020C97315|nr:hypothetical protein [Natronomonas marina]
MSDVQQPISTETALRLLAEQQRRSILRRVTDTPDGTTVDQLRSHLGGKDAGDPAGNGSAGGDGIRLHHVHLPMLREANVIDYDAERGVVRRGRRFDDVLSLLEVIEDHREETPTELS